MDLFKHMSWFDEENEVHNKEAPERVSENVKEYDDKGLTEARKKFIFEDKPRLKPAKRENIRGMQHTLSEVDKYIFFLNNYKNMKDIKARTSPGLLLSGDPGLGKTLTARYVATTSESRFIEANEFPRKEVSWTSQDVQSLFNLSREYVTEKQEPVVIFWDELEIVAKRRDKRSEGGASTVSTLTTQLDGIGGKSEGVIFIATTNYGNHIDNALLRPGRIGHHIVYTPPSQAGKLDILEYYIKQKPHDEGIDLESISFFFKPLDSPATIEETVEDAYIRACIRNSENLSKTKISNEDLINSLIEGLIGAPREIYLTDDQLRKTAIHEAGHAVVGRLVGLPVQLVSVLPHGYAEGKTMTIKKEGDSTIDYSFKSLVQGFGGVVANELCNLDGCGCSSDLLKTTEIAYSLVTQYGQGKRIGKMSLMEYRYEVDDSFDTGSRSPIHLNVVSDKLKRKAEKDMVDILRKSQKETYSILRKFGRAGIEQIADGLIEKQFVVQRDLDQMIRDVKPDYSPKV